MAGRGAFYYVTMGSVIAVVCLSANTSFADFPRLCRLLALDNHLPYALASRSRRLVNATGVLILAAMSCALLVAFGGVTDRLIPLFAIGAFGAFTLSQAGMVMHWIRAAREDPARRHRLSMAVNAVGALATGVVLLIVLVTKFVDGAWMVLVLVAGLLWLFIAVQRHYALVRLRTDCDLPIDAVDLPPPVVVIVMRRWSSITRNAIRFAMSVSDDVVVVHVNTDTLEGAHLKRKWHLYVEDPLRSENKQVPALLFVASPFRLFGKPFFQTLRSIGEANPGRTIAVVVPELAGGRWYHYLLHNQRSTALKAALLVRGNQRVVVVNVPWHLSGGSSLP